MFDDPEVIATVRRWLEKAENDLLTATTLLKLGRQCPTDTVCFHAQQCIEKYLKGLLVWRSRSFPKTHDLTALMGLLAAADRPELSAATKREILVRLKSFAQKVPCFQRERSTLPPGKPTQPFIEGAFEDDIHSWILSRHDKRV